MAFVWAQALWLLIAVPISIFGYALIITRRRPCVGRHPLMPELRDAMTGASTLRRHLPPCLLLAAVSLCIVACARPTVTLARISMQRTIMLALDISASMKATDVAPNRITAARNAAKAFVAGLPDDVKVGLVVYAGDAHLALAPSTNRADLCDALDRIQLQMGTAIGSGLATAIGALFHEDGERIRQPTIILLSDGFNTEGVDPLEAADAAARLGVRVFTVGVGTNRDDYVRVDGMELYVRVDEETLRTIARVTGGKYFLARSAEGLDAVGRELTGRLEAENRPMEVTSIAAAVAGLVLVVACGLSVWWGRGAALAAG